MRAKDMPRPKTARQRKCRTCRASFPAGQIVNGQCANCAGLVPLPLRGQGGKFLPGLTPTKPTATGRGRRDRAALFLLLVVLLPLGVLADCGDGPMWLDGVLPARMQAHTPPGAVAWSMTAVVGFALVAVVGFVAVVAWLRRPTSHPTRHLAGAL